MIYSFLKLCVSIAVRFFFRSVKWVNKERIPDKNTPLLIVANHPGTFMDPLVIGTSIKRRLFFLAKAEVFKSKFAQKMLPRLNMIPVYRKQDDASLMHKNKETFSKCYEHLKKNHAILIFPEGISVTERKLRKLKTGAARITTGAEAQNNFELGIKILPLGINYSHEIKFNSNLLVRVGEPIDVSNYKELYRTNEKEAVDSLTEEIRSKLEELIIAIDDDETEQLAEKIELIYKNKLLEKAENKKKNLVQDFDMAKVIAQGVKYFSETQPSRVERVKKNIDEYLSALGKLKLSDTWIEGYSKGGQLFLRMILTTIYLFAGFPIYLYGIINNYPAFKLPYLLAKKMTNKPEFIGAISLAIGIITFSLFYSLQCYGVFRFSESLMITIIYFITLPLSGLFSFRYWKRFVNVRGRFFLTTLFMKRSLLVATLIKQREDIIKELELAREEYNNISIEHGS